MFITSSKIKVLLVQEDSYPFSETGQTTWTHQFTEKIQNVSYVMYSLDFNLHNDNTLLLPFYHDSKMTTVAKKINNFLF